MTYSDEDRQRVAEVILERLPSEPLITILESPDMPSYRTVMRWAHEDAEFRQNYTRAREDQGDYDADSVAMLARKVACGELDHQAGRVAIDACKWTAAVRKPKVYGTKVEHASDPSAPVFGMTDAQIDAAIAEKMAKLAVIAGTE